jgi:hypothetical protein
MKLYRIFTILLVVIISKLSAQISMPAASPSASVTQNIGLAKVTVDFSRPSLKGRKMMGTDIIPYNKIWRTGANRIPYITVDKEVNFGGKKLDAGTYGIITIPGKSKWTIIVSKNANQWGTYNYKEAEDLFRFEAPAIKNKEKEETFTMGFTDNKEESASMYIKWENDMVKFPISHDPHKSILEEIESKTSGSDISVDTYFDAANYYFQKGMDLKKAMMWANKVIEADKQYWTYNLRAKIAAKAGQCDLAVSDAKLGLELAKKDNDMAYVKNNQAVIDECSKKK